MEQKLHELKSEVKCLLEEYPEGIKVNSFWGLYEKKYHKLPELKIFGARKRSEILDRCSDVYRRIGSGAASAICMKLKSADDCGEKETERTQPTTYKPQSAAVAARQSASAGPDQFSSSGSFYQRFYAESNDDLDSTARSGSQTHHVANAAPCGSYSSLMGARPQSGFAVAAAQSTAFAPYHMPHAELFAVPPYNWKTQPAGSSTYQSYQTTLPRDSSASRSSDGARNMSPAPGVQQSGPLHQPRASPTPLLSLPAGRSSAQVSMTGRDVTRERGRRMNYSREQLNRAAEDCIDRLSVAKDYVSLEKISLLLCQDFEVCSLDELGLRQIDDLTCVNEHKRLQCKVNAYMQNFVKVRSLTLCTYLFFPPSPAFLSA